MQDTQDEVVKGKLRPVTSSPAAVSRSRVILGGYMTCVQGM